MHVITSIARREITIALRRKLVRLLFLINLVPPLVMAVFLIVNIVVRQMGSSLHLDPMLQLLQVQAVPRLSDDPAEGGSQVSPSGVLEAADSSPERKAAISADSQAGMKQSGETAISEPENVTNLEEAGDKQNAEQIQQAHESLP